MVLFYLSFYSKPVQFSMLSPYHSIVPVTRGVSGWAAFQWNKTGQQWAQKNDVMMMNNKYWGWSSNGMLLVLVGCITPYNSCCLYWLTVPKWHFTKSLYMWNISWNCVNQSESKRTYKIEWHWQIHERAIVELCIIHQEDQVEVYKKRHYS